jgi:hypothetical protein
MEIAHHSPECTVWVFGNPRREDVDVEALSTVFHNGKRVGNISEEYSADTNEVNFYPIGDALPDWIIDLYIGEYNPDIPENHGYTFA